MTNIKSELTILTCHDAGKKATKQFKMQTDGFPQKVGFSAGKFFTWETVEVDSLQTLGNTLEKLALATNKFVIRGQIKPNMPAVVQRKLYEPHAAFNPIPRPYLMLDIDKRIYPDFMNPAENPEEVVKWVLGGLPQTFQNTSCYYTFSSSQNIPHKSKDNKHKASLHLWFWCDRAVTDDEWKRYFNQYPLATDVALFSPVQIHYTANPIFTDMNDPLSKRSGFYQGEKDELEVPNIPVQQISSSADRWEIEPIIHADNMEKALEIIRPYYREGSRDRLCGAVAATLYRRGWRTETVADFIYELAISKLDEEANSRYQGALRACSAVDDGNPIQGIPVLTNEFKITKLDEFLSLLGIDEPNVDQAIEKLNNKSELSEIETVMALIARLPKPKHRAYIDKVKAITKLSKPTLQEMVNNSYKRPKIIKDLSDVIVQTFLSKHYHGSSYFLRSSNKTYWRYNGSFWEKAPDDLVKKEITSSARNIINIFGEDINLSNTVKSSLNLLEGESFQELDPFRLTNQDMPAVINCHNGELWFDEKGETSFKPHRADSYLRYCLNADYNPRATAPKFNQALLDIFSHSSAPEDMARHFMELAGYICQPWRKIAVIVLLHGGGSNGKSSLMSIINRVLGYEMVMAARINEIGKDKFKIGSLDGKLLLCDDDVNMSTRLDDGFLKTISEQKLLTGEQKYKDPFQFICRAIPVMLANDYPLISDLTDGLRRRMMVIPFARKFTKEERKLDLFDQIWAEEASGILNQIIAGFANLKKRGRFEEPEDCLKAKDTWLTHSNILATFINEACDVATGNKQGLSELYAEFKTYCEQTGAKPIPRQQWLKSRLEQLGYEISESSGAPMVRGIKAKSLHFE
jgi:P4 family phage/plasmid primase-like protien